MSVIIFDFDGVLADSFDILYEFSREAMARVGVELTAQQYRDLFDVNPHLGFRQFLPDDTMYQQFVSFKKENFAQYYANVALFPGAANMIRSLADKHDLAIASSTLSSYINDLLTKEGIEDCFKKVIGTQDSSKIKSLEDIRDHFKTDYSAMTMISDTTGDLATAQQLAMKTIAVTWGFHSADKLAALPPTHLVDDFAALEASLTAL